MSTGQNDFTDGPTSEDDATPKRDIQSEMSESYLTYAMSVIISRALPDVRDGLKPSQRRILVAMNELSLGPNSSRIKCAKISGDTSGNYHPHGEGSIYPTLVRLAQNWVMRNVLVDKQGNFGSLAGLPPAAMRYTEARLSAVGSEMLRDLDRSTVDYVPTYDQRNNEPVVLPSRFPNLLVNGSTGIAVGMATSIPPHNLSEVCDAIILLIDRPEASIEELLTILPGPDFPTGGTICGRMGIRQGYLTGRSTLALRAKTHFTTDKNSDVIVVTEIPYLETRDRIREKLEHLVRDDRIKGISRIIDLTDRNVPPWQVRLHIVLKRDADKDVVLNQLFRFSPLQSTVSVILLALVGNRPQMMTIRELLDQFLRHRVDVIRRRTEFLLGEARKRKHTVEGLLIAQIDIDQVIQTIRQSSSRSEAREQLQQMDVPAALVARALGDDGFQAFQTEQGVTEQYRLSKNQAEAIVAMQLGSLANLEREKLAGEHGQLLTDIAGCLHLLSDEAHIRAVVREDMLELQQKYGDQRRTEISDEEFGDYNRDDLITEEPMVVTLSHRGYIKRTQLTTYQAQNRGGKGITGAKKDEEDPIEHLFVASTHAYLLFFTDRGKVYWQKVYDLPLQGRTARGRAVVNLLSLRDGERISNCLAIRDFDDDHYLLMATRSGIVKKTVLSAYSRPMKGGIIAINLDQDDDLIDVRIVAETDDVLLCSANGRTIRFAQSDARSMGRATRGVRGIAIPADDTVVGMVVADPAKSLLIVCENGYGKRTLIGLGALTDEGVPVAGDLSAGDPSVGDPSVGDEAVADDSGDDAVEPDDVGDESTDAIAGDDGLEESDADVTELARLTFRRQRRGGKGLRGIRATRRNGKVVDILAVSDDDEVLMVTAGGKIQRLRACDISQIGRDTQGVRVIRLDEGDTLASCAGIASHQIEAPESETSESAAPESAAPESATSENETPDVNDGDEAADSQSET